MATPADLSSFNELWKKLQQASGIVNPSPFPFDLFTGNGISGSTVEIQNVYVDGTTGSDSGTGTASSPFKTIQAALDSLPKVLRHRVTVNVAAGNYAGAIFDGFDTRYAANFTTEYSGLELRGTMAAVTNLASGTNNGTITSYSAQSGTTYAVITDSSQSWTTDDLVGRFVAIKSGTGFPGTEQAPPLLVVYANTATTITVVGPATAVGATYEIQEPATIIDSALTPPAITGSIPGFSTSKRAFLIGSCRGGAIGFSRLTVSLTSSLVSGWNGVGPGVRLTGCKLKCAVSQSVTVGFNLAGSNVSHDTGILFAQQCCFDSANNMSAINISGGGTGQHNVTNCVFRALSATSSTGINMSGGQILLSSAAFRNYASAIQAGGRSFASVLAQNLRIDGGNVASSTGINVINSTTTVPLACTSIDIISGDISNCASAAIILQTPLTLAWLVAGTGTGNAIGISLAQGAKIKVGSGVTLTGTAEVQLDGAAATTLAAMRAASPKLLTNTYGTIVYE